MQRASSDTRLLNTRRSPSKLISWFHLCKTSGGAFAKVQLCCDFLILMHLQMMIDATVVCVEFLECLGWVQLYKLLIGKRGSLEHALKTWGAPSVITLETHCVNLRESSDRFGRSPIRPTMPKDLPSCHSEVLSAWTRSLVPRYSDDLLRPGYTGHVPSARLEAFTK